LIAQAALSEEGSRSYSGPINDAAVSFSVNIVVCGSEKIDPHYLRKLYCKRKICDARRNPGGRGGKLWKKKEATQRIEKKALGRRVPLL